MGEGVVASEPQIIISEGLGSCVVVALYDTGLRIGGMAHILLPYAYNEKKLGSWKDEKPGISSQIRFMYADSAISSILKEMRRRGVSVQRIVAKMAGGARMFSDYEDSYTSIGERNITGIKYILEWEKIPLIGRDTGGSHGRSVEFYLESGRFVVKAIGMPDKEI